MKYLLHTLLHNTTIAVLVLAIPIGAAADVIGTPTLSSGQTLNLDTGTVAASGGDILWNGSTITPQGSATALALNTFRLMGSSSFAILTQTVVAAFPGYTASVIPAAALAVNDIFAVKTNGGNYAVVLVTAQSGTSITLQFVTFGSAAASGPTITQVENYYSMIPGGFGNSGIAQGTLFTVKGSGLADPAAAMVLQSSASPGLQTTLHGASAKVTVGSTTVVPVLYYAVAGQLDLVLPSNTPAGAAQITVTYNGQTSAPFAFQVVASAFGLDTYYGNGSGLGIAQNPTTGAVYSYNNAIPPGAIVTLWGAGLGADAVTDTTYTPGAFTVNGLAHIYFGGVDARILYQGRSGYPGVNQVNVIVPTTAPTGCNVAVVGVTAAGLPTNFITLPIGNGVCSDPAFGITGTQLSTLSGQANVKTGTVELLHSTSSTGSGSEVNDLAFASFQSYTGATYGASTGIVSLGGCIVNESLSGASSSGASTGLDAGMVTVAPASGSAVTLAPVGSFAPGVYEAQLAAGFIPSSGGTFTFHGAAGTTAPLVGPFNAMVTFSNPLFNWTNQSADATITRSAGVHTTWTGGASGSYVSISGNSSSGSASGGFTCIAPLSAGAFDVPSYVLAALPASSMGSLSVANQTTPSAFMATGLDYGYAAGLVVYDISAAYN